MATSHPFPSWWGPKQYVLAAIAGTLVASAVVIVTSVVLSPARIYFSAAGASIRRYSDGQAIFLNFTIAADNPSHRAGVQYRVFTVSLQQFSARNMMEWTEAKVLEDVPFYQPPVSSRNILVTALFVGMDFSSASHGGPPFTVLVREEVRFKVWLAYSRQYAVAVDCAPVDFFTGTGSKTNPIEMAKCIP